MSAGPDVEARAGEVHLPVGVVVAMKLAPLGPRLRIPRPRLRLPVPLSWLWTAWLVPTHVVGHLAGWLAGGRPPRRVRGPAASAWLYEIRPGFGLDWVGAVTLGHVVLHRRDFFAGELGQLILAHELAHTRQHDVLGPLYLPLHILAQAASAALSLGRRPQYSRVHDYNPLEQTFICLGASACERLARERTVRSRDGHRLRIEEMLGAFGLPGADRRPETPPL